MLAEGYLIARRGSGTYVAEGTYLEQHKQIPHFSTLKEHSKDSVDSIDFRSGIPALDLFPRKTWLKLAHIVWNDINSSTFGYDVPEGRPELRVILVRYLQKTRGVFCDPEQIVITSGAVQALTLVSKLILSPGDDVLMEDPITNDIQTIFKNTGASICPVPVDNHGIMTSMLPVNKSPKLIFTTPSHQFPLGGTLSIQRRIQLVQYARNKKCYLVEDDYDSEFRYESMPISSLQGLEPERVIYVGSFSKILSPALRIGYLVLPPCLIEKCRRLKWLTDLHNPSLDQLVLAQFISEGYLERHIRKMKKIYKYRRDVLIHELKSTFANEINIFGYSTGLHLIVEFKQLLRVKELVEEAGKLGVKVYPVEAHFIEKGTYSNQLIIGYGHLAKEEIKKGVSRLHTALFRLS